MKIKYTLLSLIALIYTLINSLTGFAQGSRTIDYPITALPNQTISEVEKPTIHAEKYTIFKLNLEMLKSQLEGITYREGAINGFTGELLFPLPDGSTGRYSVKRNQTLHPELNARYTEIKTFDAYGIDNPGSFGKWDITPKGLHAMLFVPGESTIFIDPLYEGNTEYYIVYRKEDLIPDDIMQCGVSIPAHPATQSSEKSEFGTCELRTYRLALAATGEYTTFQGGTVSLALAAQATTMNRVNGVYEKEIAITMVIVANNDQIIYTNSSSDPFTNGDPNSMINENINVCNNNIGSANYDIGHVFGTNSGGLAGLGVVCSSSKARGVTGSASPVGDSFDIDYVAHEMGHQFGANHTQNNDCNRVSTTSVEPGSASTIMGYAGICAPNVQNNSDDYFHGVSLGEISTEIQSSGHTCEVITQLNNTPPTISSTNANVTIPANTPFALTAVASDADGDQITYLWEQMNSEYSTQPPVATATNGPNFRSYDPDTIPTRYFPKLSSIVYNSNPTWEVLPSVSRTMNFRLTTKDNHAVGSCNDYTDVTLTTTANAGPFLVTYPNTTGITWYATGTYTVTWDVANTDVSPVNCSQVKILLSVDGGYTYPYTLSSATANDGSETIQAPDVSTTTARVMVISENGTFFDISNYNFKIVQSALGINNPEQQQVQVYPNPFSNKLNIQWNASGYTELIVTDLQGKLLVKQPLEAGQQQALIDGSNFEKGMYLVQLHGTSGSSVQQIIKN